MVELEATAQPVDWLTLGLTYAYMDAKFTNFPGVNGARANTGDTTPYSPRNQVHVFRLHEPAEVDAEVERWLAEAYLVGEQRHLT